MDVAKTLTARAVLHQRAWLGSGFPSIAVRCASTVMLRCCPIWFASTTAPGFIALRGIDTPS